MGLVWATSGIPWMFGSEALQVLKRKGQTPAVGFPGPVDASSRSVNREAVEPEKVLCDGKSQLFLAGRKVGGRLRATPGGI